ncbi:MAG TPA: hypothetical protein VFJ82_10325 [Longimicrobium sp.]|nr:hypothetical protein [Longimicrobium sp.]
METTLTEEELRLLDTDDPEERAFLEKLKANGVRLGRQGLNRPRVIGRQRPMWLAFIVRILRKLHVIDD